LRSNSVIFHLKIADWVEKDKSLAVMLKVMRYQLVLIEPKSEGQERAGGENVFLDDLKHDYKVYLFYYPGAMPNEDLENKLHKLGDITGKNLFVNIGQLDDPKFDTMKEKFEIRNLPVIVMTGIDGIASLGDEKHLSTAYVRIDNGERLKSVDSTLQCVQMIFNLFIGGEILEAINSSKDYNLDTAKSLIKSRIKNALNVMDKILWEKDIEVSILGCTFSVKGRQ
jgi:hypothetical protein